MQGAQELVEELEEELLAQLGSWEFVHSHLLPSLPNLYNR